MRVDVVSIFPGYLDPLELSLPGRARASGLLDLRVHDLRRWTHDLHRTVDDAPYGGGAGMVMRPEPWGEALDELLTGRSVLVVPSPAGTRFTQAVAADLATREHLVFACGRYEGIDQRVLEEAASRCEVRELSLGDYVLNGGEVAALAMVEAVVRLLPGFMGNAASLEEESHADGLLEYPVYTRPAVWRGREVPEVLLSGDHARIAAWRHEQAERRTAQRRPDLLAPVTLLEDVWLRPAAPADAGEVLTLLLASPAAAARPGPGAGEPAPREGLADAARWLREDTVLVARAQERLVGAVGARASGEVWRVDRLVVAPDLQGRGLGRRLLEQVEALAPAGCARVEAVSEPGCVRWQRLLRRAGYRPRGRLQDGAQSAAADGAVLMARDVRRRR